MSDIPEVPEEQVGVTVEEIKKAIAEQDYDTCTLDDDAVTERCISAARMWAIGKISSTGARFNEGDDVQKLIIVKRTLYELYGYIGQWQRAKDLTKDALDLIESYFGQPAGGEESSSGTGPAAGFIKPPQVNPMDKPYGG